MNTITKLGSKVDYSSQYDPSQIEVFPRAPRRVEYTAPMYGVDIWTCFEVSFLDLKGWPQFHVLRIANPADSTNIFESKSLKLYLNSFNNTKFSGLDEVISVIKSDLTLRVGTEIFICEVKQFCSDLPSNMDCIDKLSTEDKIETYQYTPSLLKSEERVGSERFYSHLLRSNCEVTGQPDWGTVMVYYKGNRKLDLINFLQYIISYRNHQEFHEPTCERVYNDLYQHLQPEELTVICQYTRRGGIDINPVRVLTPLSNSDYQRLLTELPKNLQQ